MPPIRTARSPSSPESLRHIAQPRPPAAGVSGLVVGEALVRVTAPECVRADVDGGVVKLRERVQQLVLGLHGDLVAIPRSEGVVDDEAGFCSETVPDPAQADSLDVESVSYTHLRAHET